MLKKIRVILAAIVFALLTLLFLDFTGTLHAWFGALAKIQLVPAILALNVGVMVALVLLTLIFGRVYCSVICPLGIAQDIIGWFSRKQKKARYGFKKAHNWLRYTLMFLFIGLMAFGLVSIAALIEPYSTFGRVTTELFGPIYGGVNNLLALLAAHWNSYAFYPTEVYIKSLPTFITAAVLFVLIFVLAWRGGRTWCNTVCPVGTLLGLISKYALFKPVIDTTKCNGCTACARKCKAHCINPQEHEIDYSRCVVCMDCLGNCKQGAIDYKFVGWGCKNRTAAACSAPAKAEIDKTRRGFLTAGALLAATTTVEAKKRKAEVAMANLEEKKAPNREVPLKPAGAQSLKHFSDKCIACQLCVTQCPSHILTPSTSAGTLMQPELSFKKGFCRPTCTTCSEVCPAGAILPVTPEQKSSIQIGHAVWVRENCVVVTNEDSCGNCARHCPAGAIRMVPAGFGTNLKVPAVNAERCIGCGSCEYHCPARPYSAIYVVGHEVHSEK